MIHNVTWISESELPCEPTANVILCTVDFTLPAQLVELYTNKCPNEFVYSFTYDDADLPEGYLDDQGPLADEDIDQVLCEDCWTKWARELVDMSFQFTVEPGEDATGDDLVLPSGGPLNVNGGDGIDLELIQPNELWISTVLSTDADNQLILGSDDNPYVAPSLFSPDGWYTVPEYAQWSFATSNTMNVPAGALLRYAKGDKIKIIQLGSPKYFYVEAVADTLLTLQAGSSHTILNDPIEAAYLSKLSTPVGFPSSFAFSSIISGFSVLPTQVRRFSITERRVRIDVVNSAPGTSNSTDFTMTVPITADSTGVVFSGYGNGEDNGIYQGNVFAEIASSANTISLALDGGASIWTASGNKGASFNIEYYF